MPFGSLKKSEGGRKSKVIPVKITTMDAELEFKIEVKFKHPQLEQEGSS